MANIEIVNDPLKVIITREPFLEFFKLYHSHEIYDEDGVELECDEELEPEETRDWFRKHGANMLAVENALDDCWNFYKSIIVIGNPVYPNIDTKDGTPILD